MALSGYVVQRLGALAFNVILFVQSASGHVGRGVIDGAVTDTSLSPLAEVSGSVIGTSITFRTSAAGRFRVTDMPPGDFALLLRRVGYSSVTVEVEVREGDTTRLAVQLAPVDVVLDTVTVLAERPSERLRDFEWRRRVGLGQFMTGLEVRKYAFSSTMDLLRVFQSVSTSSSGVYNTRGYGGRRCPLRVFIDGVAVIPRDRADYPLPHELVGIEVYTNSATVPPQYAAAGGTDKGPGGAACGAVLFWTNR